MTAYFKSVLEQDSAPVVLCDLNHTILYMNPSAVRQYAASGGAAMIGTSLLLCHNAKTCETIRRVLAWFAESRTHNIIFEFRNERENKDVYMVALRDEEGQLIGYYEKHEYRSRETGKRYDFTE